jgi:hypothetical protein
VHEKLSSKIFLRAFSHSPPTRSVAWLAHEKNRTPESNPGARFKFSSSPNLKRDYFTFSRT